MIGFELKNDVVKLEMPLSDYMYLLLMLGVAWGAAMSTKERAVWVPFAVFINKINENNPNFVQYELSKERTQ